MRRTLIRKGYLSTYTLKWHYMLEAKGMSR